MWCQIGVKPIPQCPKVTVYLDFLVQRLHCREQQDVADGSGVGEEHDQTVDAHAHAARGRHAVLERVDEVLEIGRASCRERV